MGRDDRESLIRFVSDLHDLLRDVAKDPRHLIHEPRRDQLAAAWRELEKHGVFERLQAELENPELDNDLVKRGLTGAQLEVKLSGFYYWLERAGDWMRTASRRWFRRGLRWADIVLGTLASIPGIGVAADGVKEIKEVFLEAAEDRERG